MAITVLPPQQNWSSGLGKALGTGLSGAIGQYQKINSLGKMLGGTPEAYEKAKAISSLSPQAQTAFLRKQDESIQQQKAQNNFSKRIKDATEYYSPEDKTKYSNMANTLLEALYKKGVPTGSATNLTMGLMHRVSPLLQKKGKQSADQLIDTLIIELQDKDLVNQVLLAGGYT